MTTDKAFLASAIVVLTIPLAAWALYKPIRVFAPEWAGSIACPDSDICLDDSSKYPEARLLYESASDFVVKEAGPFRKHPRLIFCSTPECVKSFGLEATATTVGKWGVIIGTRGWLDHYVRHEMFHHRQVEELGIVAHHLAPKWFIEGMAYSLSGDPRRPLKEPWQRYRIQFEAWYRNVLPGHLWEEAGKL